MEEIKTNQITDIPNEDTLNSIKEVDQMDINNEGRIFNSVDELMKDLSK